MASLKDAQTIIRNGHPEGWGRMLELSVNKDRAILGYNSQNLREQMLIDVEGQVLPFLDFFSSGRHLVDGHIYALEEDGVVEEKRLIYKKT